MLPEPAVIERVGVVMEPVDWVMAPVPVAVRVTEVVPVRAASRVILLLVPVPRRVSSSPDTAPATVMVPELLELVKVKSLTVEAFKVTAAALSVTETVPPKELALKVAAAVVTFKVAGVPARLKEVVLAELLTLAVPEVLAVRLVTLEVRLKVEAEPAMVREPVLAALLTKAVPEVLAVMLVVVEPVVM
jgi:hypothetical protein